MKKIAISEKIYRDKVYACWMGKNIGGTLGAPFEGQRWMNCLDYYHKTPDEAAANDDLDLQLIWLKMLEDRGISPSLSDFADYWKKYASAYPWNEYGFCNRNLARGLKPPVSGCFENHYIDEMGSPIRSEIWACLSPGDPQRAASMAWMDSALDHAGGEGMYGEMFWAAVESAAFLVNDPLSLIHIGLQMIPLHSLTYRVVKEAVWCHRNGVSWAEARQKILNAFGRELNPCHSTQNTGFTVIGWLYGKDFGDKLCIAVNCAYDTDCTGATLGALLGITTGTEGIPERWAAPIGEKIVKHKFTRLPDVPGTISELTERTVSLAGEFVKKRSETVEFAAGNRIPSDLLSVMSDNRTAVRSLQKDTAAASERVHGTDIWFHYNGEPVMVPGIEKTVGVHMEKNGKPLNGKIALTVPAEWEVHRLQDEFGQKRFGLFSGKTVKNINKIGVKAVTGTKEVESSFVMLGPGEAKGFPVNTNVEICRVCGGWAAACLCREKSK